MKQYLLLLPSLLLFIISCNDDDQNNSNNISSTTNQRIFFVSGEINSIPFKYEMNYDANETDFLFGGNTQSFSSIVDINDDCKYTYKTGFNANIDQTLPSGEFIFSNFFRNEKCDSSIEEEAFKDSLFNIENYSYGNENSGLSFSYIPETNQELSFDTLSGNQAGSSFSITKSTLNEPLTFFNIFGYTKTIEGSFSCKLYNIDNNSESLTLTKGNFRLLVFSESQDTFPF